MESQSRKRTLWNAESDLDLSDPFVAKISVVDSDESRATLVAAARAASRESIEEMLDIFRDVEPGHAFSFNIGPWRS